MSPGQQITGALLDILGTVFNGIITSMVTLLFDSFFTPVLNAILASLGIT